MELAPRMALLLYDDVPGVIGRVGNLFGAAGVNIANMTVSRNREGGKALMALSIDSQALFPELMETAPGRDGRGLRHPELKRLRCLGAWPRVESAARCGPSEV